MAKLCCYEWMKNGSAFAIYWWNADSVLYLKEKYDCINNWWKKQKTEQKIVSSNVCRNNS